MHSMEYNQPKIKYSKHVVDTAFQVLYIQDRRCNLWLNPGMSCGRTEHGLRYSLEGPLGSGLTDSSQLIVLLRTREDPLVLFSNL